MNPQQQRKSKPLSDEGKDMYFSDLRISRVGVYIFFSFLLVWIETLLNICHSACCPRNKGKQCKDKSNTSMIDFPFVGCVVIFLRTKYFLNDDTSSLKYMIRHCFEIFVYLVESPQLCFLLPFQLCKYFLFLFYKKQWGAAPSANPRQTMHVFKQYTDIISEPLSFPLQQRVRAPWLS